MALIKQPVAINFSQGLDTKTDPYQVPVGKFLRLKNSIFNNQGRLTKRAGFTPITKVSSVLQSSPSTLENLTTLNDNLIITGTNLLSYNSETNNWLNKGKIMPVNLTVQPVVRVSTSQSSEDAIVAPSGLMCTVYMDSGNSYYQISDTNTGEQVLSRVQLPTDTVEPRVFIVGAYFIITFKVTISGTVHLQYIAIPTMDVTNIGAATDIANNVLDAESGYDGVVTNNTLYIAWESVGSTVKVSTLSSGLQVQSPKTITSADADLMTLAIDDTNFRVYVSYWDDSSDDGYTVGYDYSLNVIMAKTQIITDTEIRTITSIVKNHILQVFYENINTYSFSGGAVTDYVSKLTVTPPVSGVGAGTASSPSIVLRSVGLASKAFIAPTNTIYMLVAYGDTGQSPATDDSNQPTYFLIDDTGSIYMRLAYSNGGGYASTQVLPQVTPLNGLYYVPYLINDLIVTVNKSTNPASSTPINAIFTQKGINLAIFDISEAKQYSSEIAGALHLTGGQLWEYDGVRPVEHGFQVWPENIVSTTITTGGDIDDQTYNYVFTYEWTDNQGNLHRSAPSIPNVITTSGGNTSTNTIYVPTLRLTYKIAPNPVRIVGYRWSVAQQIFYQFTSITAPVINDTTVDYVTITDKLSDADILGNVILYTTGGVIENIAAPASIASTLFKNRLFLIDSEDQNLLWFSKQVIEATPVEMSDLLTLFIAPTTGAQGSTGPMLALSAMDDKLIIFKQDAIYYITGTGPDNTGASNDFSDPIFITSTVGCANPNSIVLVPNGVMFQSDKGIWLLGRDLSTTYIGAPVETFNSQTVMSAKTIPATNQVRFILSDSTTLMYDYYFNQWSEHSNILAISATLYQGKLTYLNSVGRVFQENQNTYLDGSVPVLLALTTSWINIAGLQGFERFYFANLLGTYFSPFKLNVSLAYDYNASQIQNVVVTPDNFSQPWGGEAQWGSGAPWGGPGNVFSARVFPEKQKCQSFQVSIDEVYDASLGQTAGQGLSLSGLALIVGMKKGYRTQKASRSFG